MYRDAIHRVRSYRHPRRADTMINMNNQSWECHSLQATAWGGLEESHLPRRDSSLRSE